MEKKQDLADCVGAIYEAATGGGSWLDVGARLRRLFDAHCATLTLEQDGVVRSVLMAADQIPGLFDPHIQALNPYRARARLDFNAARTSHLGFAKIGSELVPERELTRSAYYCDFARHHDMHHMIGGMVGVAKATPIGLFRGPKADPFGPADVLLMRFVLPHLQRALELGERLEANRRSTQITLSALEVLPAGIGIVDAELKIEFVNDIARKYLIGTQTELYSRHSGPQASSGVFLAALSPDTAKRLRRLVASVVAGGSGGSLCLNPPGRPAIAMLVAPLPLTLRDEVTSGAYGAKHERHALVVMRPLGLAASPAAGTLSSLFGLTRAEEAVAMALAGGATAQEVADQRGVSLVTIRSQVRTILEKSDSENLRDLERAMATLGALTPRRAGQQPF